MKVFEKIKDIRTELKNNRRAGKTTGFVPTMVALHQGHISLIEKSKLENQITVVSIFVNPNQFNDPLDYQKYPRTPEDDIRYLEDNGCDLLFAPDATEIYPSPDTRRFDFGMLDKVMEGLYRPGNFNGVAQVVSRLFEIISPDNAYFGEKDFQQLVIIKKLVKILNYDIKIIGCPIVREPDGLAMSSRNMLLSPEHRLNAPIISEILHEASCISRKKNSIEDVTKWVINRINENSLFKVEYFQIVNEDGLTAATDWNKGSSLIGCIAVFAGNVRLIDNVRFN